ncbi:MAG: hypothetical protein IJP71_01015 [Lachnospiraceae bacterium]|nr:hypothetical protein [Lachnospiraceae bacterium]
MHSLETGIIVSIAAFFFFSFLTFTFLREGNISKDIINKFEQEKKSYQVGVDKTYNPERSFNILNIIMEGINDGNVE